MGLMLFLTILGWFAAVALALLIGYSRGYVNGAKSNSDKVTEVTRTLVEYDKAAADFCEALLEQRNQYKLIAEAYARQEVARTDVNVKAIGKA